MYMKKRQIQMRNIENLCQRETTKKKNKTHTQKKNFWKKIKENYGGQMGTP